MTSDNFLVDLMNKRYTELIEKYTPDLDEAGVNYFKECVIPEEISYIFTGLNGFIQFLEDDKLAKQLFKDAIDRYNAVTGKNYKVKE